METTILPFPTFLALFLILFILIGFVIYLVLEVTELKKNSIRQIHISKLPMGWYIIGLYFDDGRVSVTSNTLEDNGRILAVYHNGLLPKEKCPAGKHFFASQNGDGTTSVFIKDEKPALHNPQQPASSTA